MQNVHSKRNDPTRDKAGAKLAAAKKRKKEPITDTCPAYRRNLLHELHFVLSLYSLPHRRKFPQDLSSDLTAEIIAAFTCKLLEEDLRGIPIGREKYQRITKFRIRNSSSFFFFQRSLNSSFLVVFLLRLFYTTR